MKLTSLPDTVTPGDTSAGSESRIGMYLVLPVPFRIMQGKLHIEAQAANGLDRWADNFSLVTVAAPVIPEGEASKLAGFVWRSADSLEHGGRIVCQTLPWAYTPVAFLRALKGTRTQIAASIDAAQYLQFAIGGLAGDWAAVAALEAMKQGRRYAVHTDRVEHQLMTKIAVEKSAPRRLKTFIEAGLMKRYHKHVIENASLGLWHGEDCFRGYAPWCRENHLIHDIHTKHGDKIEDAALEQKLADVQSAEALRLCYAGRLDPMKAPLEWLRAVASAREMGAQMHATWFGEGPMLEEAKAEATRLNLDEVVAYPGFVSGRAELLGEIRSSHAMVATHVTPESPRNLLESLVSGTPIVGYDQPYAADLIATRGGGILVPIHSYQTLGGVIAELYQNRGKLGRLVTEAAKNGRRFTDDEVFAERSDLIRRFA